jgi:hypothetical protein
LKKQSVVPQEAPENEFCLYLRNIYNDALKFIVDGKISTDDFETTVPTMIQGFFNHTRHCSRCRKKWKEELIQKERLHILGP